MSERIGFLSDSDASGIDFDDLDTPSWRPDHGECAVVISPCCVVLVSLSNSPAWLLPAVVGTMPNLVLDVTARKGMKNQPNVRRH